MPLSGFLLSKESNNLVDICWISFKRKYRGWEGGWRGLKVQKITFLSVWSNSSTFTLSSLYREVMHAVTCICVNDKMDLFVFLCKSEHWVHGCLNNTDQDELKFGNDEVDSSVFSAFCIVQDFVLLNEVCWSDLVF